MTLTLTSTAFEHGGAMPARHTCDGDDRSPPLAWRGAPEGTRAFALIVDDPDAPDPAAPTRVFVHWVLWDLPAGAAGLAEGITSAAQLPAGTREGRTDFGRTGWGGPCPPIGRHRYFFKLYALDAALGELGGDVGKRELEAAMEGRVLARAELMGTYERS
jgi:Raf kinase inhibitor-like YbhB/YbcL family protein